MKIFDLARFFVKFNGAFCLYWAVYEMTHLPPAYRNYRTIHEFPAYQDAVAQDFYAIVLRIALQLLAGAILLKKSEEVVALFSVGRWGRMPNQAHQHNAGDRPSAGDPPASDILSSPAPRG
jgi:hypothetical protein